MKRCFYLMVSVFVMATMNGNRMIHATVPSDICSEPVYQTTLISGETVRVCSMLLTKINIFRKKEWQETSRLYVVDIQGSSSLESYRVWQDFFPYAPAIRPAVFTFGQTSLEQTTCFGYFFQGLFYMHLLDMTASLTPYEEQPVVSNIDEIPHISIEEAVCPSHACIPLPHLIESEWGEVIGHTQRIDLSYIDDIWSVVFHTPTLRISLRGEPQGEKTRWIVLEKIAIPEETPPSP